MYLTRYAFFVPTKTGKYALYNSFNNIFAIIDEELKAILESQEFSSLPPAYIDSLKDIGILREDDADELKMLEYKKKTLQFASGRTEFCILPTGICNLMCPCDVPDKTMDDTLVTAVIQAIKQETTQRKSTHLWITIAGGEPLLEPDITFRLSKELSEWAKKEDIIINNSIVTNGTLLCEDVIEKFFPYITSVQVTLEGPRHYHDKKRMYKNGKGTFDDIVQGLLLLKQSNIHTIINVPLTKENHMYIPELIDFLKGKGIHEGGITHVRLFLSEGSNTCLSYSPLCNEGHPDAEILMEVWENVWKRGFRATAKPTQTPYCSCIKDGTYTIDPEGNVYKCIQMVNTPSERAGILKDTISTTNTFYDVMSRNATKITECSQCKYAPLCAGGCPLRAKAQYNTYHAPDCGSRKTLFDKRIELFLRFKHPDHFGADEGTKTPNV